MPWTMTFEVSSMKIAIVSAFRMSLRMGGGSRQAWVAA
jgi:hypothetical protein